MRYKLSFLGLAVAAGLLLLVGVAPHLNADQNRVPEPLQPDAIASSDVTPGCDGGGQGVANPAAVYCKDLGYQYQVVDADGGQHGVCIFPDGSSCDAWRFLEGKCGESYSYCATQGYDLIVKTDGQNAFSPDYAVCVDGPEEIGAVTELTRLGEKATRGISRVEQAPSPPQQRALAGAVPSSFNWRNHNGEDWMTPVKDQDDCGSCWAHSAVGVVEAIYNIGSNNPDLDLDLSEETLVSDCLPGNSCCGGSNEEALWAIKVGGVPDELCLPFDGVDGGSGSCGCSDEDVCDADCQYGANESDDICANSTCGDLCADWTSRLTGIADYGAVPSDLIKEALINLGPLSLAMGILDEFGGYWDGDIYRCADDGGTNHDVVLVGYDDAGGYWIIKNSWNDSWGAPGYPHDGYAKVGYGECMIETSEKIYAAVPLATDLQVSKTDEPDPVIAGEQLYYTVSVSNAGPLDAPNVTVTDTLPAEVEFVVDSEEICTEGPPGVLTCNFGDLAVGATATTIIKVMVRPDTVANAGGPTVIRNEVTTSGALADSDLSNNTATTTTFVEDLADLWITKLCKPDDELLAGETATCTIYVDNLGPSDARNVHITDANVSDGAFTIGAVTASQGTCDPPSDGVVTCALGDLPAASPSEPGRATVTIDITATEAMDINDVATVVSDTPDPDASNNQAQDSISVTAVSDLALTKSDSPDPVVAGTNLTYTLVVTNEGPSTAVNVLIEDVLPAEASIISVTSSAGTCNAGVPGDPLLPTTCTFDTMPSGGSQTMTIVVQVKPDAVTDVVSDQAIIHNDARASSDVFDPDNNNNLASQDTTVEAEADVALAKAAVGEPVAGQDIHYEYQISNLGPSVSRDVTLRDALPVGIEFLNAFVDMEGGTGGVPLPCTITVGTNDLLCPLGDIGPTNGVPIIVVVNVHIRADVPEGTLLTNSADVLLTDTPDPDLANNLASVTVAILTRADLAITKSSDADIYKPSSAIVYTLTVVNNGPSDAHDVVVTDPLPIKKQDRAFAFPLNLCTRTDSTFTCDLGTIPAGGSQTVKIVFLAKGNRGEISNTASVTTSTTDPDPTNNSSTKVILVKGGIKTDGEA